VTSNGFLECLDAVERASAWKEKHRKLGFGRGVGVAGSCYISGTNYPIYPNRMPQSAVQLQVDRSGRVAVFSGASDIGQGSTRWWRTSSARSWACRSTTCACCPPTPTSRRWTWAPTRRASPSCWATPASTPARKLKRAGAGRRGRGVGDPGRSACCWPAAWRWTARTRDAACPSARPSTWPRRSTARSAPRAPTTPHRRARRVPRRHHRREPGLLLHRARGGGGGGPGDRLRGVERIWVAHDCGRALNPAIVEGQMEGSAYMGFAEALMEEHDLQGRGARPRGAPQRPVAARLPHPHLAGHARACTR
jgi:4-hydroxybenzoyl-CoA reductase subunit alpha